MLNCPSAGLGNVNIQQAKPFQKDWDPCHRLAQGLNGGARRRHCQAPKLLLHIRVWERESSYEEKHLMNFSRNIKRSERHVNIQNEWLKVKTDFQYGNQRKKRRNIPELYKDDRSWSFLSRDPSPILELVSNLAPVQVWKVLDSEGRWGWVLCTTENEITCKQTLCCKTKK